MTEPSTRDTGRLVARKAFVEVGGTGLLRSLSLVRLVVLARLFVPEEYGAYSTGLLVLAPGLLLLNAGFRAYAVKASDDRLPQAFTAALVLTTVLTVALAALMAASAPLLAGWLGDPELVPVVLILTLSLADGPLGMYQAILDRRLDLLRPKLAEAVAMLVGLAATVALHRAGMGPAAAMAAGHAITTLLRGASLVWLARPLPRLAWDRAEVRASFDFSLPMVSTSGFAIVGERADDMAVRIFHGNASLALYSVAFYAPALLQEVTLALDRITLPVLASLSSPEARREAFADSTRVIAALTLPVGAGLAAFSLPLLVFGLGGEWAEAAVPMSVLGVAFAIRAVAGTNWGSLAFLSEQTRYVGRVSIANAVLVLALGVPMVYWQGPLGGALYTLAYALVLGPVLRLPLMRRALGSLSFLRAAVRPAVVSFGAMAGALAVGSQALPPALGTAAFFGFLPLCWVLILAWDGRLRGMVR